MISYDTKYRVCYADTDRMGIMYYGNYPRLYEIGEQTSYVRSGNPTGRSKKAESFYL